MKVKFKIECNRVAMALYISLDFIFIVLRILINYNNFMCILTSMLVEIHIDQC